MFKKKFYKLQKGFYGSNKKLVCGFFFLKALEVGNLSIKQLESIRRVYVQKIGHSGYVKLRVKPNFSVTKKGIGSRMGSGTGSGAYDIFKIRKGQVLLEVSNLTPWKFLRLKKIVQSKIPFRVSWVCRD